MISVCIPIYNFKVVDLVQTLDSQIKKLSVPCELILIDDGSKKKYKIENLPIQKLGRYIELDQNIGRSAIRNLFLKYAQYNYLLFLDCDGLISNIDFLNNYVKAISKTKSSVICGGRVYPIEKPDQNYLLRWTYGVKVESENALERSKHPNRSFMTNNFLIDKTLFNQIQFDERLKGYGHEDTLFGLALKKNGIEITHIENPVVNGDLESNYDYLTQTEQAIKNLVKILEFTHNDSDFIHEVNLLKTYFKIKGFKPILKFGFWLLKRPIRHFLERGSVSLFWFNVYKMTYLAKVIK
ncbi:MAG: glycosyltransferase family 2 protein [Putridiphycobacter sp.]